MLVLAGDGAIGPRETAPVPVLDNADYAVFSGGYVLGIGHAWAVQEFLRHGAVEDLGEWREL